MLNQTTLKRTTLTICAAAILVTAGFVRQSSAADDKEDIIKDVMTKYHKAPKGTEPTFKKAMDGKATPEEMKKLVEGYKSLTTVKPPRGDEASWKGKTAKLYAASMALQKGEEGAAAKFKVAVDCKACHSVHKPQ